MPPPPPSDKADPAGIRLAALREACGLSQHAAAKRTAELQRADPDRLETMSRSNIANQETRGVTWRGPIRATLAALYGMSVPTLDAYLRGDLDLDAALRTRSASTPPASGLTEPSGPPRLRTHPRWTELCVEAVKLDATITSDVLRDIGEKPFLYGPIEGVDANLLASMAHALQVWRRRTT